jgi:2-polyprenyl-3-methyl-5-hydroxy-6-metoxy-1,4-benzoquinol methylase
LRFAGVGASTHPRLLDAGCGAGPALGYLQKLGFEIYGSDLSLYPLLEANKRAPEARLAVIDLEQGLPFARHSFNIILASEVVEHLHEPGIMLAECFRALRPGGCLLLTTPNLWDIRRPWAKVRGKVWSGYQDPTHINLMTPLRLKELVKQAGFDKVKWRTGIKPWWERGIRRFRLSIAVPYPPVIGNGIMMAAYKLEKSQGV